MLSNPSKQTRVFLNGCLLLFCLNAFGKELTVVSDIYCPYICKGQPGNQGFITELTREAFKLSNIDVNFLEMPWLRATYFFTSGGQATIRYHGLLLTNRELSPQAVLNQVPLIGLTTCFYRREDFNWSYQGANSTPVRLGLIQGYGDYEELAELIKQFNKTHPVHNISDNNPSINALRRLLGRRFDVAVMDENVANYLIHQNSWQDQIKAAGCTKRVENAYIGFPPDDKASTEHANLLDKGLKLMQENGRQAYWQEKYRISR